MQSNCNGKLQSRSTAMLSSVEEQRRHSRSPWSQSVASSVQSLPLNISVGREFSLGSTVDRIAFILTDGYRYNIITI